MIFNKNLKRATIITSLQDSSKLLLNRMKPPPSPLIILNREVICTLVTSQTPACVPFDEYNILKTFAFVWRAIDWQINTEVYIIIFDGKSIIIYERSRVITY